MCDVPECGREIPDGRGSQGGLEICDRCRSAVTYARRLGPKWLAERKERLHFLSGRSEYIQPLVGKILRRAAKRVAEARARAS
jgi:hypothetical protein